MAKEKKKIGIEERIKCVEELRQQGINPYPYRYNPTHTTRAIRSEFEERVVPGQELEENVSVAGRVMAIRRMGSQTFVDLQDQHGLVQVSLRKDVVGAEQYLAMKQTLDRGDIVGVEGTVMKTKRGELTVQTNAWELLTKAVRPLPDRIYRGEDASKESVVDVETRYKQPELRFLLERGSRDILVKRSRAISLMRAILERQGYMEVETPLLQPIYGGASARPFVTHLNALNMEAYLSISPELYLKRLVVGGFYDGVYTICKNFRNEGVDRTHNPEFTMMECYKAWWDYNDLMRLTENMWEEIFTTINGTSQVEYHMPNKELGKQNLDFKAPWPRRRMTDIIAEHTGLDVAKMEEEELRERVKQEYKEGKPYVQSNDYGSLVWGEMVQILFEAYGEHHLIQPTFVIDHPRESTPLCKGHRTDMRLVERFEPFVYGVEIGNAYSELNDPILQRSLLEEQAKMAVAGNEEAHRMDEYFCRAIEYGMPPTAGLGIGIDRLVMFLTGATTIREVIPFPFVKYEAEGGKK